MVRPSPPSGGHEARARVPARTHTHAHSRTHAHLAVCGSGHDAGVSHLLPTLVENDPSLSLVKAAPGFVLVKCKHPPHRNLLLTGALPWCVCCARTQSGALPGRTSERLHRHRGNAAFLWDLVLRTSVTLGSDVQAFIQHAGLQRLMCKFTVVA